MNRELLQQALDALQMFSKPVWHTNIRVERAIAALEAELAKPEQDHGFDRTASHMAGEYVDTAEKEPVAENCNGYRVTWIEGGIKNTTGLLLKQDAIELAKTLNRPDTSDVNVIPYTSPPRKEWVGLTGEERAELALGSDLIIEAVRTTEAKLEEKNHD